MNKTIPVNDLAVGMRVVGMDKSWLSTPFFRHRLTISTQHQIEELRAAGVEFVQVELAEASLGHDTSAEDPESATAPTVPILFPDIPEAGKREGPSGQTAATSYSEELPAARNVYREARKVVTRTLNDARLGRDINTEAVSQVVSNMIDSVLRNMDAITSLSRLKDYDEYTFFHSVNTALLALAMGRSLGMEREELHMLGTGSLLHDIGKMKIPLQVLNKPGRLRDFEFEIIKQHALRGAEILTMTTGLKQDIVRPALEHHERVNGTGYPFGKSKDALSLFGLITSIVDVYDAVTSDRVYHKAMPPHQAVKLLYDMGRSGHLDAALVARFVRCVGVYPVGSCVRLATGNVGIVSRVNHDHLLSPEVLLIQDQEGRALATPHPVNLAEADAQAGWSVTAVLDPADIGVNSASFLDGAWTVKEPGT